MKSLDNTKLIGRRLVMALFLLVGFSFSALSAFLLTRDGLFTQTSVFAASVNALPDDGVVLRVAEDGTAELTLDLREVPTDTGVLDVGDQIVLSGVDAVALSDAQYAYRSQTFGGDGEFACQWDWDSSVFVCEVLSGYAEAALGQILLVGVDASGWRADSTLEVRVQDASVLGRTVAFGEGGGVEVERVYSEPPARFVLGEYYVNDTVAQRHYSMIREEQIEAWDIVPFTEMDARDYVYAGRLPLPPGMRFRLPDFGQLYEVVGLNTMRAVDREEWTGSEPELGLNVLNDYNMRLVRNDGSQLQEPSPELLAEWLLQE